MATKELTEKVVDKTIVSFAPVDYVDTIKEELDRMNFNVTYRGWFDLLFSVVYKYSCNTTRGCISRHDFRRMMNEYMEREYKRLDLKYYEVDKSNPKTYI